MQKFENTIKLNSLCNEVEKFLIKGNSKLLTSTRWKKTPCFYPEALMTQLMEVLLGYCCRNTLSPL